MPAEGGGGVAELMSLGGGICRGPVSPLSEEQHLHVLTEKEPHRCQETPSVRKKLLADTNTDCTCVISVVMLSAICYGETYSSEWQNRSR